MPIRIALSEPSSVQVHERASDSGLPLDLWARLAIEGSRQVERTVDLAEIERCAFAAELDERAAAARHGAISTLACGLRGYARLLRAAAPVHFDCQPQRKLTLLIPDQLAVGWASAANAAGMAFDVWSSEMILVAPAGIVTWEAAAAEAGDSLGEWILAAALARSR